MLKSVVYGYESEWREKTEVVGLFRGSRSFLFSSPSLSLHSLLLEIFVRQTLCKLGTNRIKY